MNITTISGLVEVLVAEGLELPIAKAAAIELYQVDESNLLTREGTTEVECDNQVVETILEGSLEGFSRVCVTDLTGIINFAKEMMEIKGNIVYCDGDPYIYLDGTFVE